MEWGYAKDCMKNSSRWSYVYALENLRLKKGEVGESGGGGARSVVEHEFVCLLGLRVYLVCVSVVTSIIYVYMYVYV